MSIVKGVANATDVERIEFEILGTSYWIAILKDPPAKVWNEIKTVKPGESAFDQDTRVLEQTLQDWDLGIEISRVAIEDLQEPVRQAMVHLVTRYYVELQKSYADILQHIYRPGGDGAPTDPSRGGATASDSPARSRASRRTT
jgi:Phage tail assembly chaperone